MNEADAMEQLATMIQAVGESESALSRVMQLKAAARHQRDMELQSILRNMIDSGEDEDIIQTFRLFSNMRLFDICYLALVENDYLNPPPRL